MIHLVVRFMGVGLACALMAGTGCQSPNRSSTVDEVTTGNTRKPAPDLIALIDTPKYLREDTLYPGNAKQSFQWGSQSAKWTFRLPAKGFSYAGFRLLTPLNLAHGLFDYEIMITLFPANRSKYLWLGLVDGDDVPHNILVDLPLADFSSSFSSRRSTEIRIPIHKFPQLGVPVLRETKVESTEPAPFDWQDVREIRLINNGGSFPPGDVIITDLRIIR